jgi:hypothetical protein
MNIRQTTNTLTIELEGADRACMELIVYHYIDSSGFGVDESTSDFASAIANALDESGTR